MKRKTTFLKSLLVAVGLLVGATSAWAAGYTRTLSDEFELAGYKAKAFYNFQTNSPEVLPTSGDLRYRDGNVWGLHNFGSGTRSGTATIPVKEGEILVLQHYSRSVVSTINRGTLNETQTAASDKYEIYDITSTADDITFSIARYGGIVAALVMEKDASAATATYTINYKFEGTTVKTVSEEVAVGTVITIESSIWVDDVKYIKDDATESFTVAAGGNTQDINVRKAETYSYTLKSSLGATLKSGTGVEGESVTLGYPRYQLSGNTLYEAGKTGNEYRRVLALTEDNVSATITYTAIENVNAVFYIEGEDLAGMTLSTANNIPVRASNAEAGVATEIVPITTLPAGIYKLHAGIFTSKSSYGENTVNFGVGTETFAAGFTSVNLCETASEEYILGSETAITFNGETSWDGAQLDYIWIEKLSSTVTATFTKISKYNNATTFSSKYALDFTSTTAKAYVAKSIAGGKVTLQQVTGTVAANTGLVLKLEGTDDLTEEIPVVAEGTAYEDNLLVAVSADTQVEEGYVLSIQGPELVFAPIGTAKPTVEAGHAYLKAVGGGEAKALTIDFGTATGISSVKSENKANGQFFNLAGQRVAQPTKGLYIVNGNKVIIK